MIEFNKKCSVLLTGRDFSILKSLYDNVVMGFMQITELHFTKRSKPTVVNRLTKLERAGFIQRFRIPRLEVMGSQGAISVIFQITKLGIHALQKRHPGMDLKPEPIKLRPYSVDHDLLLVDVIGALKNKFTDYEIIHGELYFKNQIHTSIKPDAVLIEAKGNQVVAVELELTAKSEKRYRELILKYRLSKDFSKVLYITSHPQIEKKIKAVMGASQTMGKFEFLPLNDLLRTKNTTKESIAGSLENNNFFNLSEDRKECVI